MKDIAKKLLETSIYPTPDEFREITDTFMKENHEDFIKAFKRPDKWLIYYKKYVKYKTKYIEFKENIYITNKSKDNI